MKYLPFLLFIALSSSCHKSAGTQLILHDTVTSFRHDTSLHAYGVPLYGTWVSMSDKKDTVTFDAYFMNWNVTSYIQSFRYVVNGDTIYNAHLDYSFTPRYGYSLSPKGDTLTVQEVLYSPFPRFVLYRLN